MSFVPNRDLKRLNPMSNDWGVIEKLSKIDKNWYYFGEKE